MVFHGEHIPTWDRPDVSGGGLFSLCALSSCPPQSSQGGGHRTLLYGHAILLRHAHSGMVSASARGSGGRECSVCQEEADHPLLYAPST